MSAPVEESFSTADVNRLALGIKEPHRHDVLCGRGGTSNHHHGNAIFRTVVAQSKPLYYKCQKHHKIIVARAIVQAVSAQNPSGRFLIKDKKNGLWYEIDERKAVEKTSQALREKPYVPLNNADETKNDVEESNEKVIVPLLNLSCLDGIYSKQAIDTEIVAPEERTKKGIKRSLDGNLTAHHLSESNIITPASEAQQEKDSRRHSCSSATEGCTDSNNCRSFALLQAIKRLSTSSQGGESSSSSNEEERDRKKVKAEDSPSPLPPPPLKSTPSVMAFFKRMGDIPTKLMKLTPAMIESANECGSVHKGRGLGGLHPVTADTTTTSATAARIAALSTGGHSLPPKDKNSQLATNIESINKQNGTTSALTSIFRNPLSANANNNPTQKRCKAKAGPAATDCFGRAGKMDLFDIQKPKAVDDASASAAGTTDQSKQHLLQSAEEKQPPCVTAETYAAAGGSSTSLFPCKTSGCKSFNLPPVSLLRQKSTGGRGSTETSHSSSSLEDACLTIQRQPHLDDLEDGIVPTIFPSRGVTRDMTCPTTAFAEKRQSNIDFAEVHPTVLSSGMSLANFFKSAWGVLQLTTNSIENQESVNNTIEQNKDRNGNGGACIKKEFGDSFDDEINQCATLQVGNVVGGAGYTNQKSQKSTSPRVGCTNDECDGVGPGFKNGDTDREKHPVQQQVCAEGKESKATAAISCPNDSSSFQRDWLSFTEKMGNEADFPFVKNEEQSDESDGEFDQSSTASRFDEAAAFNSAPPPTTLRSEISDFFAKFSPGCNLGPTPLKSQFSGNSLKSALSLNSISRTASRLLDSFGLPAFSPASSLGTYQGGEGILTSDDNDDKPSISTPGGDLMDSDDDMSLPNRNVATLPSMARNQMDLSLLDDFDESPFEARLRTITQK